LNQSTTSGVTFKLYVKGDFSHTGGTIKKSKNSAKIEFNGSNEQTIQSIGFYDAIDVTTNNSNGFLLNSDFIIPGTFTMTAGNINTASHVLSVGISTTVPGSLIRTSGSIIGNYKKWITSTGENIFPLGTSLFYRPIKINFTSLTTAGYLIARFYSGNPWNSNQTQINDNGYILDSYSSVGYWDAYAGNGLSGNYNMNIEATYFGPGGISPTNFNQLRIIKSSDNGSSFSADGTHTNATNDNTSPYVNRTNINTGFSRFAIAGNSMDGNPLDYPFPVGLLSFTSSINKKNVLLCWTTINEVNNYGFDVERKFINEFIWHNIRFVKGCGNTNWSSEYSFEDKNLNSGKYQYRLKQIDYNGYHEYFELANVVEIGIPEKINLSQNYPNPFNPVTKVDFDLLFDSKVSLLLFDVSGRVVKKLISSELKYGGYYSMQFNASDLSSGVYFIRLTAKSNGDNFVKTIKAILLK
jgi:hypothetical protein